MLTRAPLELSSIELSKADYIIVLQGEETLAIESFILPTPSNSIVFWSVPSVELAGIEIVGEQLRQSINQLLSWLNLATYVNDEPVPFLPEIDVGAYEPTIIKDLIKEEPIGEITEFDDNINDFSSSITHVGIDEEEAEVKRVLSEEEIPEETPEGAELEEPTPFDRG